MTKYDLSDRVGGIHDYDLDISGREIYLFGREDFVVSSDTDEEHDEPGVEYTLTNRFIRNLNILSSISEEDILIHMKTCGGDWTEGMAIYDAVYLCPCQVTIINYTHARSMSSLILGAADWRVMMPHSYFMFHEGTMGYEGTVKQFESFSKFHRTTDVMLDIYVEQMLTSAKFEEKSRAKLRKYLKGRMQKDEEVYLTPQEAVEWGLADEIFTDWSSYRG